MIFPSLKKNIFGYVNLNFEAQEWISNIYKGDKEYPLTDPVISQEMIDYVHSKYSIDYSYGGWMEDRSFLWKGTYLEGEAKPIHLGVDINVPAGSEIAADFNGSIVRIDDDFPEEGGWGPRIIVKHDVEPIYMIYAHLDREINHKVGDILKTGDVFAKVGKPPYNGNWFAHVHVQVITEEYYNILESSNRWRDLDGYGSVQDISSNAKNHRDPLAYIKIFE
jgi:murein DD-endopeptidase MepM/ murein hydrolase activator NlpD